MPLITVDEAELTAVLDVLKNRIKQLEIALEDAGVYIPEPEDA